MKTIRKHVVILLAAAIVAVPSTSFAKKADVTPNDWTEVQSLKANSSVVVMTKSGEEIKGKLQNVSETSIVIGKGRKAKDLRRENIIAIFTSTKSVGKSTLIGTAVGYGSGAIFGAAVANCKPNGFICVSTGEAIGMLGPIVAVPGALAGFLIGEARHKHVLIYSAKP